MKSKMNHFSGAHNRGSFKVLSIGQIKTFCFHFWWKLQPRHRSDMNSSNSHQNQKFIFCKMFMRQIVAAIWCDTIHLAGKSLILHELMNVSNFYLKANTHFLLRNQFLNKKYTNLWKLWNLYACSKCQIRNFRVTFMRY